VGANTNKYYASLFQLAKTEAVTPAEQLNSFLTDEGLAHVATCGYNRPMTSTGIRELKDNLSRYIRRIEAGERIAITAHGRVVAELVPPGAKTKGLPTRFDELVASGVIRPPVEAGDPTEGWPDIRLPAGTAAELIDADRGEA
jgi:antitoxin (DNA-binding transcriptional repressor) of toxin-antitoxin stability system